MYKPKGYNSVAPYFVMHEAREGINLLLKIFDGEQLRTYEKEDGSLLHAEIRIDDSILMFGNASPQFPANQLLTHIYVPDVDKTYQKAIDLGCESVEAPKERPGDPDRRGSFKDMAGNMWSIGTQCSDGE